MAPHMPRRAAVAEDQPSQWLDSAMQEPQQHLKLLGSAASNNNRDGQEPQLSYLAGSSQQTGQHHRQLPVVAVCLGAHTIGGASRQLGLVAAPREAQPTLHAALLQGGLPVAQPAGNSQRWHCGADPPVARPGWCGAAACLREQAGTEEAGQQCNQGGRQRKEGAAAVNMPSWYDSGAFLRAALQRLTPAGANGTAVLATNHRHLPVVAVRLAVYTIGEASRQLGLIAAPREAQPLLHAALLQGGLPVPHQRAIARGAVIEPTSSKHAETRVPSRFPPTERQAAQASLQQAPDGAPVAPPTTAARRQQRSCGAPVTTAPAGLSGSNAAAVCEGLVPM
ncbi:hypothetical protein COCOBI_03-3150 [Coccomyxa sp. Obi]|nr:hypothetical protein COCOBI_03-3150 [Coccomyxa sp. Obi]